MGTVRDITQAEFDAAVVQGSRVRPVVVDFWAPWCGPCRHLSPLLERVADRYAGDVDVVKLNVDEAPEVARRFRVQGIPAVKAFKDGAVVGEFVGVQPEATVDQLFASVAPTEADRLAAAAAEADDDVEAERLLRLAVEARRDHPAAIVALAGRLIDRGGHDEAVELLQRVPGDQQARRLLARLRLTDVDGGDDDTLRRDAEAGDVKAALHLGQVLAGRGEHDRALPWLLTAVREPVTREDARASVVAIFEVLGPDDELVRTWRPKLAAALF